MRLRKFGFLSLNAIVVGFGAAISIFTIIILIRLKNFTDTVENIEGFSLVRA